MAIRGWGRLRASAEPPLRGEWAGHFAPVRVASGASSMRRGRTRGATRAIVDKGTRNPVRSGWPRARPPRATSPLRRPGYRGALRGKPGRRDRVAVGGVDGLLADRDALRRHARGPVAHAADAAARHVRAGAIRERHGGGAAPDRLHAELGHDLRTLIADGARPRLFRA